MISNSVFRFGAIAVALLVAFGFGAASEYHFTRAQPYRSWSIKLGIAQPRTAARIDTRLDEASQVACGQPDRVIVIIGQSNVANKVDERGTFPGNVRNFYDGKCYKAADPLLGATGATGSVWSRIAWQDEVLLVPLAVGSTMIGDWAPGGPMYARTSNVLARLDSLGLSPTHIVMHQGEDDAMEATDPAEYEADFQRLLVALKDRTQARVIVGQTSHCRGVRSEAIIAAQLRAIAQAGVERGPNTDELSKDMRYDDCHFNAAGAQRAADMWAPFVS